MRFRTVVYIAAVLIILLASLAAPASAYWFSINGNSTSSDPVTVVGDQSITVVWQADSVITVNLRNPSGGIIESETGSAGILTRDVSTDGTYTVEWVNENAFVVGVNGDITTLDISPEDIFDSITTIIIVAAVGIIAVIVVIVLVIVYASQSDKRRMQQAQQPMGYIPPPPPPGVPDQPGSGPAQCPMCRSPIDSSMAFCQRCGHRLR